MKLIRNRARCKKRGDVIEGKSVHDFVTCKCGAISVDGGLEYFKRVGDLEQIEELSESDGVEEAKSMDDRPREPILAADKSVCLRAIDLIIMAYLPSINGKATGHYPHTLKTWETIREIVENAEVKEGRTDENT